MTNEQLCALALAAIDDADARVVLADAIEESGWWDERVDMMMRQWAGNPHFDARRNYGPDGLPAYLLHPRVKTARAIAAVLLFGEWPTRWELAERCETVLVTEVWSVDEHGQAYDTGQRWWAGGRFPG